MRASFALPNLLVPEKGGIMIPLVLDFSASQTLQFDFALEQMFGAADFFQSIYIKNRPNVNTLTLTFPASGYSIVARSAQEGEWPLLVPKNAPLTFTATTATVGALLLVVLQDIPCLPMTWSI